MKSQIKVAVSIYFLFIISLISLADAVDSQHVQIAGRLAGRLNSVAVQGNYAYVAESYGLIVMDISNPANPRRIGSLNIDMQLYTTSKIVVNGNYAYLAGSIYGLHIVDISTPSNPVLVSTYDTPGGVYDIVVRGNYAYLADGSSLQIINISTASHPTYTGSYATTATRLGIIGNYAYISNGSTMNVINISTASNPTHTSYFYLGSSFSSNLYNIAFSGNYAYFAEGYGYLEIFDVSTPSQPVFVIKFNPNQYTSYVYGVAVNGNYAYLADNQFMDVVDISSPSSPVLVSSYTTSGASFWGIEVKNNYAYAVGMESGFYVFDVSTASAPVLTGEYLITGQAYGLAVSGNYLYAGEFNYLKTIDLNSANSPRIIGKCKTTSNTVDIVVSGNKAYTASGDDGFLIFDISTPSNPGLVGSYNPYYWTNGVAVSGNYAYAANEQSGLYIFDITTSSSPNMIYQYILAGYGNEAYDVVVKGNYAYVAWGVAGLHIVDISDPYSPISTGTYNTPGEAVEVAIKGDYAYVADYAGGLRIIDISTVSNPHEVGSYNTGGQTKKVTINGNYAYVVDFQNGLRILNIADPIHPTEAGYFKVQPYNVTVGGKYIYLTSEANLWVLEYTGYRMNSYGDFTVSSDTSHWYWEKYGDGTGSGTLSWTSTFAGQSGIVKMTQTAGQKGKITQVFSVPSTGWYTAITKVATDIIDTTKQQKVYLYLQELDSSTAVAATGNLVMQSGAGGFGKASTWRELSVSFYCQSTLLGVQVVGINPASSGVSGNLYIDSIWVYAEAPQSSNSLVLNNGSFNAGTTGWMLNLYADGSGIGSWSQVSSLSGHTGLVRGTQTGGQKAKLSQLYSGDTDQTLATVWVYSSATTKSQTQKVYLYVYSYDSVYNKVIESGNGILQAGKWTPNQWRQLQFGYTPFTEYNAVQVVGINATGNPSQNLYFDAIELKQE